MLGKASSLVLVGTMGPMSKDHITFEFLRKVQELCAPIVDVLPNCRLQSHFHIQILGD
uniref:Uncharacterized protein n=1 Tax=Rhizophora mucronata TaxID=61149 RepID=A0A2P2P0C1_RHIMU